MKVSLIIVLVLMVLVPVGLMVWLGVRATRGERAELEASFRRLHTEKLQDMQGILFKVIERRERPLLRLVDSLPMQPPALRDVPRTRPEVRQIFLLSQEGKLLHPPVGQPLSLEEEAFLTRAQQVWRDQDLFYLSGDEAGTVRDHGWYTWYWGSGIQLVLWSRLSDGRVLGFELDRFRFIADLIAELPASSVEADSSGLVALVDSKGETLYQWGTHEPAAGEEPVASLALRAPLNAWRLAYYVSGARMASAFGAGIQFSVVSALVVVGLALGALAFYVYRESSRALREARQRVSFVNHVSHELKTPLTNIRMYAELLAENLEDLEDKPARYLAVLVAEGERLSRLIDNVLTFARQQRRTLRLRKTGEVVDRIIERVLEGFRPRLQNHDVWVTFKAGAPGRVQVDADAVGQILCNLLSNVEKYAPGSGEVVIESRQQEGATVVQVQDQGPGIEAAERERVFEPFVRLGAGVAEGVAGTGIGLSISRDLARLHGGEITLLPAERGARFELRLATEPAEDPGVQT